MVQWLTPWPFTDLESSSWSGNTNSLSHPFTSALSYSHRTGHVLRKDSSQSQERGRGQHI